jgi:hypothetical protein
MEVEMKCTDRACITTVLLALASAILPACAGGETNAAGPSGGNGGSKSASVAASGAGPSGSTSSASGSGAGGASTSGASSGSGGGGTAGPGETPYFNTPAELCDYVNQSRMTSSMHQRYRGEPWKGVYHDVFDWPLIFTIDPALNASAQAEADSVAAGASPKGTPHTDGILHQAIYVIGWETASYMITSQQFTGDWDPADFKAGLINANGTARMAIYYHDSGGVQYGPTIHKVGCGGAFSPKDGTTWWVVKLAP